MMRRIAGGAVGLGVVVVLSGCAADDSSAVVAPTDPVVVTSVTGGEPAEAIEPAPTLAGGPATAGSIPTSAVAPVSTTAVVEPVPSSSEASDQVVGVVVAVDGDLSEIRGFSLLSPDGAVVELVPQPSLLFDEGPLSHLRDHLVSGAPVSVVYRVEDRVAIATSVGDAP